MFGNPLLLADDGYQISRSVRLRSSASAYFNRTPASASNRRTWTWSGWVKLGSLASGFSFLTQYTDSNNQSQARIRADGVLRFYDLVSGSFTTDIYWSPVYRDPSSWYHLMLVADTTQATNTNRIKLYVNGVQVTSTSSATWPSQNTDLRVNLNAAHFIGQNGANNEYADGYLAEVNFIDGQALTPSSFGETDVLTGVWKPKKYTGTYGTNGFYLNFSDPSAATATTIGRDYSGNGNNWTPNNISVTAGTTYDSMLDVPTLWADGGNGRGNYCVMNPLDSRNITNTFTLNGNLGVNNPSTGTNDLMRATFMIPSGKWYWEATLTSGSSYWGACIIRENSALAYTSLNSGDAYAYSNNGTKNNGQTSTSYGNTYTAGDVVMVAFDAASGKIWFGKNGTWQASGDPVAATNEAFSGISGNYFPGVLINTSVVNFNFGQRPFTYTPPTGFRALNTQNLPAPTIVRGNLWMDATLYTGTGATLNVNNAAGFAPDLVWIKSRSDASSHGLHDRVRGEPYAILISNSTAAESTGGSYISSFGGLTSTGFQLNSNTSGNGSGSTYVGWQWRANGTPAVTNTAGSITSTVSASATSGFSVVTYTGTGANATVGHGLGVAPRMIIFKRRSATANWAVYHASIGNTGALALDLTIATDTNVAYFNNTSPTSSVFTVGTGNSVNASTSTYVAYLFAPVAGFSAFGSYTGNGSSDGAFVFTGFRPRYVLIKRSGDGTNNWEVRDSARDTYNAADDRLFPNTSAAEDANNEAVDFLANGFKIRNTGSGSNASSATYIYAAFAEFPFRTALAR